VRADRLLALVLLLQARGRATAQAIAAELEVSVRTVYRDLEALVAAGVPVLTESGPGGGCRLMEGYRFPLRGLRLEEAEALLILGVPGVLRELGLDRAVDAARRQIRITAGGGTALVHLDLPRWFSGQEEVPCLREVARALRSRQRLTLRYRPQDDGGDTESRVVGPVGLVNKAGLWYLVASPASPPGLRVFRVARIASARALAEAFEPPDGFDLAAFWRQWSAEFEASRPRLHVTLRASPSALAAFGEIFGQAVRPVLDAALPPDEDGWRVVTLTFEHELAAAGRLAGFGDQVQVLTPAAVRDRLVATARQILRRYDAADGRSESAW
jgi:predicted DNA-binding transcriptional regulator YafY